MTATAGHFSWPLHACPRVRAAGRFTQRERDFAHDYRNRTLTVHLYAYRARVRIGDQEFRIEPGDLTITPPQRTLRFANDQDGVHWCLRLDAIRIPGPPRIALPLHRRLDGAGLAEARRRFAVIIADHGRSGEADDDHPLAVAAALAAQNLLCWIASGPTTAIPGASDPVEKARTLLANQQCARVPISEIAKRSGMSQNRLAQAFRDRLGLPMREYRTRCLIETAMQLLLTTDLPMSEIRERVDIPNPHHFNKVFRRVTGLGPRAWLAAQGPLITTAARPEA